MFSNEQNRPIKNTFYAMNKKGKMKNVVGFIILMLSLLTPKPAHAAGEAPRDSNIWVRADSLRRQIRHAADHGRMLQWGDSLVRKKLKMKARDSLKNERIQRHLARADRHLFFGDSLLARKYSRKNFDTLYIARPDGRWTIKLRMNISGAKLRTEAETDGVESRMEVLSEFRGTVSVAVSYRGIGLGLAVNPAKWAGKNKDFEFNLHSYGNRYGFDVVYLSSNTYKGKLTNGAERNDIDKGLVSQDALTLNFYYVFNGKRFSFPAAFSQSYLQRRSAGSWMLGASFDGSKTRIKADEEAGTRDTKLSINELAIGGGYAYNLVAGKRWLFHLSALPTLTVYSKDRMTVDGERRKFSYSFPSGIITARGAAVYSWRNKFLGANMVFNHSFTGHKDNLKLSRSKWYIRGVFGFRF